MARLLIVGASVHPRQAYIAKNEKAVPLWCLLSQTEQTLRDRCIVLPRGEATWLGSICFYAARKGENQGVRTARDQPREEVILVAGLFIPPGLPFALPGRSRRKLLVHRAAASPARIKHTAGQSTTGIQMRSRPIG